MTVNIRGLPSHFSFRHVYQMHPVERSTTFANNQVGNGNPTDAYLPDAYSALPFVCARAPSPPSNYRWRPAFIRIKIAGVVKMHGNPVRMHRYNAQVRHMHGYYFNPSYSPWILNKRTTSNDFCTFFLRPMLKEGNAILVIRRIILYKYLNI